MSNIPRKEYPRPQFVRENWMNLNGTWAFEIDNGRSGEARGLQKVGTALSGEITVPFCRKANFPVCSTPILCTAFGISAL